MILILLLNKDPPLNLKIWKSEFSSFSEVSLYWYTGNSHLLPQIGKVTDLKRKVCKGEMHRS